MYSFVYAVPFSNNEAHCTSEGNLLSDFPVDYSDMTVEPASDLSLNLLFILCSWLTIEKLKEIQAETSESGTSNLKPTSHDTLCRPCQC